MYVCVYVCMCVCVCVFVCVYIYTPKGFQLPYKTKGKCKNITKNNKRLAVHAVAPSSVLRRSNAVV